LGRESATALGGVGSVAILQSIAYSQAR
jgi:hypothetical protein